MSGKATKFQKYFALNSRLTAAPPEAFARKAQVEAGQAGIEFSERSAVMPAATTEVAPVSSLMTDAVQLTILTDETAAASVLPAAMPLESEDLVQPELSAESTKPSAPTPPDTLVQDPLTAWTSELYRFSVDDITISFDGTTLGDDPSHLSDTVTKESDGVTLYAIDSEFGFYVNDFIGAQDKVLDGDFAEGWAGTTPDGYLMVANAPTDLFSTPAVLGTWLEGIGGNTVKASTEHYTVMQAVLSDQAYPGDTSGLYQLDDDLRVIDYKTLADGMPDLDANGNLQADIMHDFYVFELVEALGEAAGHLQSAPVSLYKDFDRDGVMEEYHAYMADIEIDGIIRNVAAVDIDRDGVVDYFDNSLNGFGTFGISDILKPNESSILEDIAYGDDYSVTLKDDGKLLYRWGNAIKRPNDVRIDAKIELPEEWAQDSDSDGILPLFHITAAELVVNHTVTNNPNDQIRPEDFENESAIGQLPSYEVNADGQWVSIEGFYAGDGTYYPPGTVLMDPNLAELAMGTAAQTIGAVQEITSLTEEHRTIAYQDGATFENPVVFASPLSYVGPDTASVRIVDVSSSGATICLEEAEYLDGTHWPETVSLVTFEEGSWTLDDGSRIEVGTVETDMMAQNGFVSVAFEEAFDEPPAILVQVQTSNGWDWVVVRARNVTETGFELAMQEEEGCDGIHNVEVVGWAALDASAASGLMAFGDLSAQVFDTGTIVDHNPTEWTFDAALGDDPLIAASISSFYGPDTVTLRVDDVTASPDGATASFFLQEEQSVDEEMTHYAENVTGVAFSGSGTLTIGTDTTSMLAAIGALSSDLVEGFTEAWYTTMDREPFVAVLDPETGEYEIGPRWRLQPDKYGQDLPSVVIPQDPSDPLPTMNGEEKYEVGADTTTVLNLLDWDGMSPMTLSAGWMTDAGEVSDNGLNMTEDFDIAFYVKGDMKPVTLYDAQLVMTYEPVDIYGAGTAETPLSVTGGTGADILVGMGFNDFYLGEDDGETDLAVLGYGAETVEEIGINFIHGFVVDEDVVGLIGFDLDVDNFAIHLTQEVTAENDLVLSFNDEPIATMFDVTSLLEADSFYFA